MSHIEEGLLHAWLDDEVSANEARTVEEHLESCGSCQRMLDEAARTRALAGDLMADLTADSVPEWEEIVKRAAGATERSPGVVSPVPAPPPRRLLAPALAWAATLAVAFLLGWQARLPQDPAQEQRQIVAAIEPSLDDAKSELKVTVDSESLAPAPIAKSRVAAPGSRAAKPEPLAAERAQQVATPEKPARGEALSSVASPEFGRASARRRTQERATADVAERREAQPEAAPAVAPLRKIAGARFLAADEIAADQLSSAEPEEDELGGERRPLQLAGAVLESTGTVSSGLRIEQELETEVLRSVYQDPQTGVRVTLLQRFVEPRAWAGIGADVGTSPATATLTVAADGRSSLRWLALGGVLLTLEAELDEAGLRELALRVR